ncbi:MAG: glycoside hydrolase family 81, partial [Chthoniobacter sp.]|nr:glycoside hydrolase family 81 [Chthoniobacter sp.]
MSSFHRRVLVLVAVWFTVTAHAQDIVKVGKGSYTTKLPAGARAPQKEIYRTDKVKGPMPTNDWWSSLAWKPFGDALFPHPLAVKAEPGGLRVAYPGANITANKSGIFGGMPGAPDDFTIGHSAVKEFPEARVDGYSDWFVDLLFRKSGVPPDGSAAPAASGGTPDFRLRTSFGHGSPFVYVTIGGGDVTLDFGKVAPKVWSGTAQDAVLGITIGNRHYGLFAPTGSTWSDLAQSKWTVNAKGKGYFSAAVLPDNAADTLKAISDFAHNHVVETHAKWSFPKTPFAGFSAFDVQTRSYEGKQRRSVFSLYPHQRRSPVSHEHTEPPLFELDLEYHSIRGRMWLGAGTSIPLGLFSAAFLPTFPIRTTGHSEELRALLKDDLPDKPQLVADTYWLGKQLGKWATLLPIAEQLGDKAAAAELTRRIKASLENFFTASDASGAPKTAKDGVFYYDANWGTLIGYPASFGSDVELNDHHFHYGYFIRAAAEIARRDAEWAKDWGGMVRLLIRDIASADRQDPMFPFLRNFDPYAGHSWASGHAKFGDGNNNESSSEAVNAWYGLILWA